MSATSPSHSLRRVAIGMLAVLAVLAGVLFMRQGEHAYSADLSPLETRVLGQTRWLAGGPASLRVIVANHRTGDAVRANVQIALSHLGNNKPGKTWTLYDGRTTELGTLDAQFTVPSVEPGPYQLTVAVDSSLGTDEITQQLQLEDAVQVMLTCDKPLYQPGQTMHLRALALDMGTRQAVSSEMLVFEIEDARGNKVFKKKVELSQFGLGAVDFTLADEVNMGTYTLRAILPHGQTEKKVRVERYVLPKFKMTLKTDKPYYLPGETVKGTLQVDYFFGKPVANGEVGIEVSTVDIGVNKLAELKGKTDATGTHKFEYLLPKSFVGQPFEQGKAVVEFHVVVQDTAAHTQEMNKTVPVVKDPILLVVVPESRPLVPGLKNRLYLAAATPDGAPLENAKLTVWAGELQGAGQTLTTDAFGMAMLEVTPGKGPLEVKVLAVSNGKQAELSTRLDAGAMAEGIILRAGKSLAKVGDRVNLAAIATTKGGTVYLDVIRNKQTILTKALPVNNGYASCPLNITDDMVGTLELHAYKILPNEEIIRDTQVMVVSPADDLTVSVTANQDTYRPGEEASLTFTVQDPKKHPILAALGVVIVDESVYALSELQPGLEKIYFMLEKELMEPKYEIHGLKPVDLVLDDQPEPGRPVPIAVREAARQRAAAMLFAAVPKQGDFDFRVNTYQQRWEKMKTQVITEMQQSQQKIIEALGKYQQKVKGPLTADQTLFALVDQGYLKLSDLKDHWGHFYKVDVMNGKVYQPWNFAMSSAGPDGRWNSMDDIAAIRANRVLFGADNFGLVKDGTIAVQVVLGAMAMPVNAPMAGAQGPAGHGGLMAAKVAFNDEVNGHAVTSRVTATTGDSTAAPAEEPVRIREYFPETMYWNPAIITDEHGKAQVTIPMADSITTWRMSMMANSASGQLGSASAPLRVFQDFFVDIDLPLALTQHDRVEIPVAVYNYLPESQQVNLRLEQDGWFTLEGSDEQVVHIGKDQVKVVYFPITVNQIGHFPLTVHAKGTRLSDAVRRSIDILPDGKEFRAAINDRLEGKVEKTVTIPAEAIDGASNLWVKLYPGAFSQVVEGLDGLLRMPSGCFEQTSSTAYPNILVLDYLKKTKKINPEIQMKAEQYVNVGYQRLVTFECKNGGFSWFGDEPAHQALTAYGLLEFTDMAKVHEVDPALISRTQQWLAGKQKPGGTWKISENGIAEGIINRQTGTLRTTAYIAWALAESGYTGPQVNSAVQYVKAHRTEAKDPYTLAVILNLLAKVENNSDVTAEMADALIKLAVVNDKVAYWGGGESTKTFTGATAQGADLETTGMAAYGLVKWGRNSAFTNKVLMRLIQSKDSFGTWSTTQGTVWSMKALIYATSNAFGGGKGKVIVMANGHEAATFEITEDDNDVMRQADLSPYLQEGDNNVVLEYQGEGSLLYQIVSRHYLPWHLVQQMPAEKAPMTIKVTYDRTTLAQDDTATATVTITNNLNAIVEMPLIDIGLPPGFTPVTERLEAAVEAKKINKYTVAARQIIVYLEKLAPNQQVTLTYQLKAKYPIRARTPQSIAYPYYNPEQASVAAPQNMVVTKN